MRALQITGYLLLVLWLTGCATVSQERADFAAILAQTTHEITTAANTIADAADAGLVSRESEDYKTVKQAFLSAATYLELAWSYYGDGQLIQADGARQAALAAYMPMRQYLVKLQKEME